MTLSDDVESMSAEVSAMRATIVLIEDEALFAKAAAAEAHRLITSKTVSCYCPGRITPYINK